jgi:hypothetical protein
LIVNDPLQLHGPLGLLLAPNGDAVNPGGTLPVANGHVRDWRKSAG